MHLTQCDPASEFVRILKLPENVEELRNKLSYKKSKDMSLW